MHPAFGLRRDLFPDSIRIIKKINIPRYITRPAQTVCNRFAGYFIWIVKVGHTMICEPCGSLLRCLLRITRKLIDPDDADTDISIREFMDNRFLYRPGTLYTSAGSGRREQGQKTGALSVAVEMVL